MTRIRERAARLLPLGLFGALLLWSALCASGVTLAGDDWGYAVYLRDGLPGFLSLLRTHFLTVNGRTLVHALDVLLLQAGGLPGKCLLPVLIGAAVFLSAALAARAFRGADFRSPRFRRALGACSLGFWLISPEVLREAVFWLTGAMNYLFPADCLLLCLWLLGRRQATGRGSAALLLSCVLTALTTEQAAAAALIVAAVAVRLPAGREWRHTVSLAALVLTADAAGTVFFAPGNAVREGFYASFYALTPAGRMLHNLPVVCRNALSDCGTAELLLLLFVGGACRAFARGASGVHRARWHACGIGLLLCAAGEIGAVLSGQWDGGALLPAIPALLGLLLWTTAEACALAARRAAVGGDGEAGGGRAAAGSGMAGEPGGNCGEGAGAWRLLWVLLAALTQGGLLLSPVQGARCVLPAALLLLPVVTEALCARFGGAWMWLAVAGCGLLLPVQRRVGLLLLAAALSAALLAALVLRRRGETAAAFLRRAGCVCLVLVILAGGALVARGYLRNGAIFRENDRRVADFTGGELRLLRPVSALCHYMTEEEGSAWHRERFRNYAGLPPETVIIWE